MTLSYDPYATNHDNRFADEQHDIIDSAAVFPLNGPFYDIDLVVTGIDADTNVSQSLVPNYDYAFSPLFASRAAATGKSVYSFIVVIIPERWQSVFITYRAVGGDNDATLLTEIANLGNFNRLDPSYWVSLSGENVALRVAGINPDLQHLDMIEILNIQMEKLISALGTPQAYSDFVLTDYAALKTDLLNLKSYIENATTVSNGLIFDATQSVKGVVRLASVQDAMDGTLNTPAITPLTLSAYSKANLELPFYPEIISETGALEFDVVDNVVTVVEKQIIKFFGWQTFNTTDIALVNRQFTPIAGKLYHLYFNKDGTFSFIEVLLADSSDVLHDSTYDTILVAVIDLESNDGTINVVPIVNQRILKSDFTVPISGNSFNVDMTLLLNWGRTPELTATLTGVTGGVLSDFSISNQTTRYSSRLIISGEFAQFNNVIVNEPTLQYYITIQVT